MEENVLVFFVNGQKVVEHNPDPETTLLHYLRTKLLLPGTKLGCGEGGCGACTVMVSRFNPHTTAIKHYSVNACLAPVCSLHGLAVTTVEGIGSTKTRLHPVQACIAKSHGSQCGFCTPGIVMSMYTLLRNNPQPSRADLETTFEGNLCRCTGYRPILDGFSRFTHPFQCPLGEQCCQKSASKLSTKNKPCNALLNGAEPMANGYSVLKPVSLMDHADFKPYDPTQEPIFPSELQLKRAYDKTSLKFVGENTIWFRPVTMSQLLDLKTQFPQAKLVAGNTEIGVEMKLKNRKYPVLISISHIEELSVVKRDDNGIKIGGSVTLSQLEDISRDAVSRMKKKAHVFSAILEMLRWFAGQQIRNVAVVAGNITTASPISDLNPIFMAARCAVTLKSKKRGTRDVVMDNSFFTGYRKTCLEDDEVLLSVYIPYNSEDEYFFGYKQAQRREDDIAIVNSAMKVSFETGSDVVKDIVLAYGGMAPTTILAKKTASQLVGRHWDEALLCQASDLLAEEMNLPGGTPGGQEAYRCALTLSFFYKFYVTVKLELQSLDLTSTRVSSEERCAAEAIKRETSHGSQMYEEVSRDQPEYDLVGRPQPHLASFRQATGEAQYTDDIRRLDGELYAAMVISTKAHARLVKVDPSKALLLPGVVSYIDHNDIPGTNVTGNIYKDELVFAEDLVTCEGQIIGVIVADTQAHAQKAAKAVEIHYEELKPIITIEQAIEADSIFDHYRHEMSKGDVEAGFKASDHIIEGEIKIGSQEQFYLETQAVIAIPKEDGEIEVISSSQSPSEGQMYIADVLGIPGNRVTFKVRRLGGGFGGKQTNFKLIALPVAVAAVKLNCPVRCMLDRDEDMLITGKRNPYLAKYKVGFNKAGTILAVQLDMYANGGNSLDLSGAAAEKSLLVLENCYRIEHVKARTFICQTNIPSNTAFRGFGGPQGMFICESWLSHIASYLNVKPEVIREHNLFQNGDETFYGHKLEHCTIKDCYFQSMACADFPQLRQAVDSFNKLNRWKKRGLAVVPTKFGISYAETFLNQAGALVHIYIDGSVLIAHSGVEMGQGLHTKMIQVASRVLGLASSRIHISESSTMTVPNMTPTAASCTSDMNGMAIKNACEILLERLKPYKLKNPTGTWENWVTAAFFDRVSLSATGYFKTPGISWSWKTKTGIPYAYYTYGAAASLVEIDCLTGDHSVLRTDIVMDVGHSLNPAVDIGQIEGGFLQGYGLFTIEDIKYSPQGHLLSKGPGMYKIPTFTSIPVQFNVSLLKNNPNPRAIYSSKGIGEPPLFLGVSVFFAIKDAIMAARAQSGLTGYFRLDAPATSEKIRMLCEDQFTKKIKSPELGSYTPWNVQL